MPIIPEASRATLRLQIRHKRRSKFNRGADDIRYIGPGVVTDKDHDSKGEQLNARCAEIGHDEVRRR